VTAQPPHNAPPQSWDPGGIAPPPGYVPHRGYGPPPPGYGFVPPPVAPGGQRLAEFWERLVAHLIDSLLISAASMILTAPFFLYFMAEVWLPMMADIEPSAELPWTAIGGLLLLQAGLFLVMLLLAYVYYVEVMLRGGGQTLGKRALKLRIVPLDPAARLGRGMALRRYLVQFGAGFLIPAFSYLDGLWQLWDKPYRQCLHDKWAQTVVVKQP
jgi:uncharacterized RDD family membrane protein YckC